MSRVMDRIIGDLTAKARWNDYRRDLAALPRAHRLAAQAWERYLLRRAVVTDSEALLATHEEMLRLVQDAADGGVGVAALTDDPVAYAEALLRRHGGPQPDTEADRLRAAFDAAARAEAGRS